MELNNVIQAAELEEGRPLLAMQQENDSDCCVAGKMYPTYTCSRPLYGSTKAYLTLNSFEAGGDGGGHQNVTKDTTMTTHQLLHCPLDGTTMEEGAITTSQLALTGAAWWPWWWMSVTLLRDVMQTMTTNLLVLTILLMLQRLSGKPWVCLRTTAVSEYNEALMKTVRKIGLGGRTPSDFTLIIKGACQGVRMRLGRRFAFEGPT
ncbi:hypothetical protein Prudu_006697 [Prunus dulcis]|uniref:Uncharacterized protein n=1 Tax=Prunus dulcis TaxID=3755 RepID=A0A4Y1R0B4_PRUDU|nr:hypothetical protein Prudu_006697 [Prunus dulcis]